MSLRNLTMLIVATLAVAACSMTQDGSGTGSGKGSRAGAHMRESAHDPALGTWVYRSAAYPSMCITFLADGGLLFRGGFLAYNPGRWERGSQVNSIRIRLGGTSAFPLNVARYQMKHRPDTLVAYDEGLRSLEYRITGDTQSLDFMNFVFYRDAHCPAN